MKNYTSYILSNFLNILNKFSVLPSIDSIPGKFLEIPGNSWKFLKFPVYFSLNAN